MEKLLKKLEKRQQALVDKYHEEESKIQEDSLAGKLLSGDLADCYSWDFTYKGVGLRICYWIQLLDNHFYIVYFGTFENFYEKVKRYIKA